MKKLTIAATTGLLLIGAPAFAQQGMGTTGTSGSEDKALSAIQEMDKDGNNKISRNEFVQSAQDEFQKSDSDKSGSLEQQEQQQLARDWSKSGEYSRGRMDKESTDIGSMGSSSEGMGSAGSESISGGGTGSSQQSY